MEKIQQQAISAIRVLSAETVERAASGHPGMPLGAAPMVYALWENGMTHCPKNPDFINRDRFVLSAGHGSALLYSMLYAFGYPLTKEDLMSFRQLRSKTPGHPEIDRTPGVETSTGPLGQGIANAVGFALAESMLAAKYNRPDLNLVDHYTYCVCGDGCMMEGIESEAASLAGTWKLGKLIVLYDSNRISIEGDTDKVLTEDVAARHRAQGWQVLNVNDGEDVDAITAALKLAKDEKEKPSLIIVKTVIGYGSPKAGSADTHGAPLGEAGVSALKNTLGLSKQKPFEISADVQKYMATVIERLNKSESEWNKIAKAYKAKYPEEYERFLAEIKGKSTTEEMLENGLKPMEKNEASRVYSGAVLNRIAELVPTLVGGSADLSPSNKTYLKDKGNYSASSRDGRNIYFGVREHAMAAICNGIARHGGFEVFCSTFFVFSDYMKNAMRMSALMNLPVTYILTHDSIGVGEDGPTHQPIEQLVSLRSIPGMKVFRPADSKETIAAYVTALTGKGPTAIVCSRQTLAQYPHEQSEAYKGGYILSDSAKEIPDVILIASGSEVQIAMQAKAQLADMKVDARVVSMPCMELFDSQTAKYRDSVLPPAVRARVAVEAGSSMCWGKYVGLDGACVCMDGFGSSAPANKLFEIYGFTAENVAKVAIKTVRANK